GAVPGADRCGHGCDPVSSVARQPIAHAAVVRSCSTRIARLHCVTCVFGGKQMAKRRKRRYSRGAGSEVKHEMHRYKRGTAKSGRGGRGGKVKSRKQAIAIGLS